MTELTLGLIADTHVPDRVRGLHPRVLPIFEEAKVTAILHAGDICVPGVLAQLAELAPVLAVRGNRDFFGFKDLPLTRQMEFAGVQVGLAHGHLGLLRYLSDRLRFLIQGPQTFDIYAQRVADLFPQADVVVFGHIHDPLVRQYDGKLVVNPGSAGFPVMPGKPPSVGLLHIGPAGVRAEILPLV